MLNNAKGRFDVKLTPESENEGSVVGRMTIDKQFQGDLEGTSKGLMVMAGTSIPGSAGYVAIEKVTGTVHGKSGTFYLQHNGIMNRGDGQLSIVVIPDSGTGELEGLSGTLDIQINNGDHFYDFNYKITQE